MPDLFTRSGSEGTQSAGTLSVGLDALDAETLGMWLGCPAPAPLAQRQPDAVCDAAATADCVITRLILPDCDALELAEWLCAAGFEGRLVVVTPPLPRPDIVADEIAAHCPGAEVAVAPLAWH